MALSFEESVKQARIANNHSEPMADSILTDLFPTTASMDVSGMVAPAVAAVPGIMTLDELYAPVAYSGEDGSWKQSDKYEVYKEFTDDNYSIISDTKEIALNVKQFSITQEENSQYIPFEAPLKYDGFDLSNTTIQIHFTTSEGYHNFDKPINVTFNNEKIRFGWLIGPEATQHKGKLSFEIHAYGQIVSASGTRKDYVWKTQKCDKLNVLESLCKNEDVESELDPSWVENLVADVAESVAKEIAAQDISAHVNAANEAASRAESAAGQAESVAYAAVSNALQSYSTTDEMQRYVADSIDNADIDGKLTEYAKTAEVEGLVGNLGENDTVVDYVGEQTSKINDRLDEEYPTKSDVQSVIGNLGESKTVVDYVGEAIKLVDVTEQLADYVKTETLQKDYLTAESTSQLINTRVENFATKTEVSEAIKAEDITGKLGNYYTKGEVEGLLDTVEVDLTGYATESFVTNKTSALDTKISTNSDDISTLNASVKSLQDEVAGIDKSEVVTYDATYGKIESADGTVTENVFTLWEVTGDGEDDRSVKAQFPITGVSGGNTSGVTMVTKYYPDSSSRNITALPGDSVVIQYSFSGKDMADEDVDCIATWSVGSRVVSTETISTSDLLTFDVTKYLSVGTNTIKMVTSCGASTSSPKTWEIKVIDVSITSNFNDSLYYETSPITVNCVPNGAVEKVVHFVLDGNEVYSAKTDYSGTSLTPPCQVEINEHGSHLLEIYMTAEINGKTLGVEEVIDEETGEVVRTIHTIQVLKDIMWKAPNNNTPLIGCTYQNFYALQYDTTNILYYVHDFTTDRPTVQIAVDGEVVTTKTLTTGVDTFPYRADSAGEHIITITCGETTKTLKANIEALAIDVSPVVADLVFDFNPVGYSNNDDDRLWESENVKMTVSSDFDWVNGGYQIDEAGDSYFCVKAGTQATFDHKLFGDDAKTFGKEFKLIFKTTNVSYANATFLSCVDNTTEINHIGLEMNVHEAIIYGATGSLNLPYSENDIIEFEFNISPNTDDIPMVLGYEDGVATRPMVYGSSHKFQQSTAKDIVVGSEYCDVHIYRMKAYSASRSDTDIQKNFIADARTAPEMIDRYKRNQIYEGGVLTPEYLAKVCPWLRVFKVSAPYFTNKKDNKVNNTTIECIYGDGDPVLDNWVAYNSVHSGQGTTSDNYGAAGRNLDFIMKPYKDYGNDAYIQLGDGSKVKKISLTRNSVPVNYLNVKVNIASSNNMTNALLAKRYNQYNPYKRPFVRSIPLEDRYTAEEIAKMSAEERANAVVALEAEAQKEIAKIRDTMEFYNCVVFIQETNEDVSTHREFADTAWHFYAIGNVGDSKKTDDTRLTDMDDPYECCIEIMDIERPLSDFPANTMMNAMGSVKDKDTGEITYTWAKDENLGILHELIDGEYVLTQDTTVDLSKTYYVDILVHDDFSEDYTYGWRYISDDEDPDVVSYCHQKWIEFYRFVTTSTDEKFKEDLGKYAVLDSVLYYYLFTTRYCMVDNRAKNSFWHYGKTGEVDSEGNPIRKWDLSWDYDNDTSLGLDNYGRMVYRYGLEDTDVDENGKEVFREMDSTFFCRLRDLFPGELKALYNTLDYAWNANSLINEADEWQAQFPEELWRLDIQRKYIRPYHADSQFLKNMMNGRMKYHRRQWERGQEQYMASKYQSSTASSDENSVDIRVSNPTDYVVEPYYGLTITPYDYIYVNVRYGSTSTPIQVKGEPGVPVTIDYQGGTSEIKIFSASSLQSIGDLSACYPITVGAGNATRLNELIIGNSTSVEVDGVTKTYDNPFFTTLTLGANALLETLNIENISSLNQELDLRQLKNLRELYAKGTSVQGVIFADRGSIEVAELPFISYLEMHNLMSLETLDIESLDNLTTLIVENCPSVDILSIVDSAPNLEQVKAYDIDWTLQETDILKRIYSMSGSMLSGVVHVAVIRQKEQLEFSEAWPDLEIIPSTIIEQFPVTFLNANGVEIEVQYVDKGEDAVDPTTRVENPIIPTLESTDSHDFTFSHWDGSMTDVFSPRTVTAVYAQSLRSYTIKYVSNGVTLQESTGLYGENVPYAGESLPSYTAEEPGYVYHLFNRWDKSGYIYGDKVVNAIYDRFEYAEGAFNGKKLIDLSPVEIYAMNQLGLTETIITDKDPYEIVVGCDVQYDDIESEVLISEKVTFDGTSSSYIDTGIKLFDEDKDFVIAIDYKFDADNTANAVLAQCFSDSETSGFKLWYGTGGVSGVKFNWGSSAENIVSLGKREMIVLQHKKGNPNLTIYRSNLDGDMVVDTELSRNKSTLGTSTLVFGASTPEEGYYENKAKGEIYWAKIWYTDLGDDMCRSLATWTHESITLEACGFRKYFLSDTPTKRCSFSLLATHLLSRPKQWNRSNTNTGGWAKSTLNTFLNTRLYDAMPTQIKLLLKQVNTKSSAGDLSTDDILDAHCYITIPSVIEIDSSYDSAPYASEGTSISYLTTDSTRKRAYVDGEYATYWLRSPSVPSWSSTKYYVFAVQSSGSVYEINTPTTEHGVLIEISF